MVAEALCFKAQRKTTYKTCLKKILKFPKCSEINCTFLLTK